MQKLNVFVSSTCYDLNQIRVDLKEQIELLGHTPVLSEYKEFPINPNMNTVENCIEAVKNDADIFILVIGNRYGSEIDTGRSITNTEFLAAKEKGIPIYIFIDKRILSILSVWKNNKEGDYSSFVDTTKIFELIDKIRNNTKLWSYEFEKAQEITSIIKTQLSYLFKNSLEIWSKYNSNNNVELYSILSNKALKILFDKNDNYEFMLFNQLLIDELIKKESIRNDYKYNILIGSKNVVSDQNADEIFKWAHQQHKILIDLINSWGNLINNAYADFYGTPGTPSDIKGLYYTALTYARIYESFITWSIDISSTYVNDSWIEIRDTLAAIPNKTIKQTWEYPFKLQKEINELLLLDNPPKRHKSTLTLEIDQEASDKYLAAMEKFSDDFLRTGYF